MYLHHQTRPFRLRHPLLGVLTALLLVACAGEDADEAPDAEEASAAEDVADAATDDADGDDPEGDDSEGDDSDAASDADEDGEPETAPAEELVAADGWNGVLDLEVPDPGVAWLRVDGEDLELDVQCETPGELEDHGHVLFWFAVTAEGETSDGRWLRVSASRQLVDTDEAARTVYDYTGQERGSLQITTEADEGAHSSIAVSPADDDPGGEQLPILHVDDTGAFTASMPIEPLAAIHDTALAGDVEFAGRCQDSWPEDVADAL